MKMKKRSLEVEDLKVIACLKALSEVGQQRGD